LRNLVEPTPEFLQVEQRIVVLFARRDAKGIGVRYEIGNQVSVLCRDPNSYGRRVVKRLAKRIDRGARTLYDYCRVAEQWEPSEIDALVERRMPRGKALLWAHLRAVARDDLSAAERREWIETALELGLGARRLSEVIDSESASPSLRALGRILRRATAQRREVEKQNVLLDASAPDLTLLTPAMLNELQAAHESALRTQAAWAERANILNAIIASNETANVPANLPANAAACECGVMPRHRRNTPGGWVYHVLNRGVGRRRLFYKPADYEAFEDIVAETLLARPMRICGYCLMPNHWDLVVWPERDGELASFMQRLTVTHVSRWRRHRRRVGEGHLYQGRFKSFPVQDDEHFYQVMRYVERNALRANLATEAEAWRYGGLWRRCSGSAERRSFFGAWP
jgi:putative transposase